MSSGLQMPHISRAKSVRAKAAIWLMAFAMSCAWAAPGAHGPNGEHLDAQTAATNPSTPRRIETQSEVFELVAQKIGAELIIHVDRYASNEPVLNARLEVESGTLKALASFREASGTYVVDDTALLAKLGEPGEHALVFTLSTDQDTDLLDATWVGASVVHDHDHDHGHEITRPLGVGLTLLGLSLIGVWFWGRRNALRESASTSSVGSA